ncbi:MAG: response regulator transcription factor [Ktedonobacteraceae bacterium]
MRLLIVDSDRDTVEMLTSWLKTLGHDVQRAYTGERAKSLWLEQGPDVVIVDTTLKDMDALAMCRDMRLRHDALVLVLTDSKDVHDEIRCLESGADDYLRKPFYPAQLLARIRAVSRRARSTLERRPSSIISVGPICIDAMHNEVKIHGKVTRLTPTEGKLLHLLAIHSNDVCTSEQIVNHVWGYDDDAGEAGLIKAHIRHLRQKVEQDPGNPQYILTVPGVGYTLIRHADEEDVAHDVIRPLRVVSVRN